MSKATEDDSAMGLRWKKDVVPKQLLPSRCGILQKSFRDWIIKRITPHLQIGSVLCSKYILTSMLAELRSEITMERQQEILT